VTDKTTKSYFCLINKDIFLTRVKWLFTTLQINYKTTVFFVHWMFLLNFYVFFNLLHGEYDADIFALSV